MSLSLQTCPSTHPYRPQAARRRGRGRSWATALLALVPVAASAQSPTLAQRRAAAQATANSTTNDCPAVRPFYWEIGDAQQRLSAGSVQADKGPVYQADTVMQIASASKWLWSAYVVEKRQGELSAEDVDYLTFRSGQTNFSTCLARQSVQSCLKFLNNGKHSPENEGLFYYSGGHMQKHAQRMGLGPLKNASLAAELQSELGSDIALAYSQPQPAGGVVSTAGDYARFLRKLLTGELRLGALLGTHAICTNPDTCPQAARTPMPLTESWHYSLGHWVEDDPEVGDGAFSSAGAFGFYPWIDASRRSYGVLARQGKAGSGFASALCGRAIRKAWLTGEAQ